MKHKNIITKKIMIVALLFVAIIALLIGIIFGGNDSSPITQSNGDECLMIDTDYATLTFPKKWKDNLDVNIIEEDYSCEVQFFGSIEDVEKQQLFSVFFGGAGDIPVGTITVDKVTYDVAISYCDFEIKDKDINETLLSMQEDVNYLLDGMYKLDDFEKVTY